MLFVFCCEEFKDIVLDNSLDTLLKLDEAMLDMCYERVRDLVQTFQTLEMKM